MDNTRNNEQTVTVSYWRERYYKTFCKITGISVFRALVFADDYFNTAKGLHDYKNVKRSKAGLVVTRRAVMALDKYLNLTKKPQKVKRKKRGDYLSDISA